MPLSSKTSFELHVQDRPNLSMYLSGLQDPTYPTAIDNRWRYRLEEQDRVNRKHLEEFKAKAKYLFADKPIYGVVK